MLMGGSRVPYTVASFVVYENALEQIYKHVDKSTVSSAAVTGINIVSGLIAGIAAAVVSHPADTLLSKINKDKGTTRESTLTRLYKLSREMGIQGSFSGIRARIVMVGGMTAVQFAIYGDIKKVGPIRWSIALLMVDERLMMVIGSWRDWRDRDQMRRLTDVCRLSLFRFLRYMDTAHGKF